MRGGCEGIYKAESATGRLLVFLCIDMRLCLSMKFAVLTCFMRDLGSLWPWSLNLGAPESISWEEASSENFYTLGWVGLLSIWGSETSWSGWLGCRFMASSRCVAITLGGTLALEELLRIILCLSLMAPSIDTCSFPSAKEELLALGIGSFRTSWAESCSGSMKS